MFYRPQDGHGLPHNPFNAIVTPRPIGWIATRAGGVDNLAPYSFFNAIAYEPPQVMFASTGSKDSLRNIRQTGVFAVNIVAHAARDQMNASAAALAWDTDEFTSAQVPKAPCQEIDCPRVADAPATLECRMTEIHRIKGADNHIILGEVVGIHMRDDCLTEGRFDVTRFHPLARLGYRDYATVTELFSLRRPGD